MSARATLACGHAVDWPIYAEPGRQLWCEECQRNEIVQDCTVTNSLFRVNARRCETCAFHPGAMPPHTKAEVQRVISIAGLLPCHETVGDAPGANRRGPVAEQSMAYCRGFYDAYDTSGLHLLRAIYGPPVEVEPAQAYGAALPTSPADEIHPGLWVGGGYRRYKRKWDAVLTVCPIEETRQHPPRGARHTVFGLADGPVAHPDPSAVATLAGAVVQAVRAGRTVLVRSAAGINRCALVAALALVELAGIPGTEAVERMRAVRGPLVLQNPTFERMVCAALPNQGDAA